MASKDQDIRKEEGLTTLIEYVLITGVIMVLLILVIWTANTAFIENPSKTVKYHSYIDIGNGLSVRTVDLYVISPKPENYGEGTVKTKFDLPDNVIGQSYYVELDLQGAYQRIAVTDGSKIRSSIAISGIGATKGVTGQTTGAALNVIRYNSSGV